MLRAWLSFNASIPDAPSFTTALSVFGLLSKQTDRLDCFMEKPPASTVPPMAGPPPRKKRRWVLYGCGSLVALLLIIIVTVAITIWWIQRPIKPVTLSEKEKTVLDKKLQAVSKDNSYPASITNRQIPNPEKPKEPVYVPGSKVIKITEREINGLLNQNTDLGHTVRLEFVRDAINAYLAVPIPKDFPIGGGRTFRARSRFHLALDANGQPDANLEDVTVFGISLPNAWLGGIKGKNLLADAARDRNGNPLLKGIKSLHVESGALVLELVD
jgi:hypothetical protein